MLQSLNLLVLLRLAQVAVAWTATPFTPPSYPLAVRSPYLSAWLPQGSVTALNGVWPQFWTGTNLGWAGFVNVDGTSYVWLGDPVVSGSTFDSATQTSATFTSTQSIFELTAGDVDLTVTFLSPIEPSDYLNQSLPFSYLAVSVASNDGNSHSVSIYTDISAEWVSGDDSLTVNWTTATTDTIITHTVQLEDQTLFTEIDDVISQGQAYYSTLATSNMTYQTGEDIVVRAQFINEGTLANTEDTDFRAVSDDWPVFALAHDLGDVTDATDPVVWVVGRARDPAIEYLIANDALQNRSSYFWSEYATAEDAIEVFIADYENAVIRADALDAQVESDASAISSSYAGLVALSVRQAFGATEITISKDDTGAFNISDVMVFLKEISSDGNVNTVDVIFPSWPAFLYTYPKFGWDLLLPLFAYQETGQYPNEWACHDMGSVYPQATGHNNGDDETMPIEESGNMIIMTLGYVQKTSDMSVISTYYNLLDQWANYLIANTLIPGDQISTDDFAGALANQTNLAIKGIIAIKAMAEMAELIGDTDTATNYSSIASDYVTLWQGYATASDGLHLTLAYNNDSSWGLTYNMYADKLLGLDLIPDSVYEMQTAWYPTVYDEYGVPLDTRHTYTKSDWQSWTAAIMTNDTVRDLFVDAVASYAADGLNNEPLGDWYYANDGDYIDFRARPVVGGHLALLALYYSSLDVSSDNATTTGSSPVASNSSSVDPATNSDVQSFSPVVASLVMATVLSALTMQVQGGGV